MKISIWNLMRPNSKTIDRNALFINTINKIDPDILILTETNSVIDFGNKYFSISSKSLPDSFEGYAYKPGENRVTIFSKFPFKRQIATTDIYTSVCAETETPFEKLIIYGTIIGFLGGLLAPFESDLKKQSLELTKLAEQGNICLGGDLNISFSGRAYPSKTIINEVSEFFKNLAMTNLSGHFCNNAIHAIISKNFLGNKKVGKDILHFDKKITDHGLVTITIFPAISFKEPCN